MKTLTSEAQHLRDEASKDTRATIQASRGQYTIKEDFWSASSLQYDLLNDISWRLVMATIVAKEVQQDQYQPCIKWTKAQLCMEAQ